MLLGKPTRYGTGIELLGDYYDLENLYSMIWTLADTMEEESPESIMMLNISYDIRKASGQIFWQPSIFCGSGQDTQP